jgi:hypothetical protein
MAYANRSIASRIEWCRRLSTQACAPLEIAEWRAEAEGLRDALLHSDHTIQYQQGPPSVFERYATGLQDGRSVLRTAAVPEQFAPPARTATHGMGNVNMLGLTRRVKKNNGSCVELQSLASCLQKKFRIDCLAGQV